MKATIPEAVVKYFDYLLCCAHFIDILVFFPYDVVEKNRTRS